MEDKLQEYNNVSGVWAIRGKLRQENKWRWFNVAKIQDIKDEVDEDILFMSKDFANPIVKAKYVTKWNVSYEYEDYKYPQRRVSVWKLIGETIRNKCDEVEILCIAKSPEEKDLGKIERDFGFYTQAEFWSDRTHYEVEKEKMQSRIKKYLEDNDIEDCFKDKVFDIIYKESLGDSTKRIFYVFNSNVFFNAKRKFEINVGIPNTPEFPAIQKNRKNWKLNLITIKYQEYIRRLCSVLWAHVC